MLAPVLFVARSQRRSRRATMVGLALFVGIAGAIALSLIAGARRSSTVVDRFLSAAPRYDLGMFGPALDRTEVRSLPGVTRANPGAYIAMNSVDGQAGPSTGINGLTMDFTLPPDPTIRVLEGRMPDGSDPFQIAVNDVFVQQFARSVGDRVTVRMFSPGQRDDVAKGIYEPAGPTYEFGIAAVVRPSCGRRATSWKPRCDSIALRDTCQRIKCWYPSSFGNNIMASISTSGSSIICNSPTVRQGYQR